MKNHNPNSTAATAHAPRITALRCREQFTMDPAPLTAFYATHSDEEGEAMICGALEDIAIRLDRLQMARSAGAYDELIGPARRIAAIAGGLGLIDVATAAGHVGNAADSGSGVAVAATLARLERGFDAAISSVWEFRLFHA